MPLNLGSGAISGAYVGSNAVTAAYLGSTSVFAAGGSYTPITPNTDNRARIYLPASTTSIVVGAASTSSSFAITDGTTTVIGGGGYNYAGSVHSYYLHGYRPATLSGMSSSSPKVIEVYSCNSSGTPTGNLNVLGLLDTSGDVDAIDVSGLTILYALAAFSSSAYGSGYTKTGQSSNTSSSLPSTIREIRAVGTPIHYTGGGGGPTTYAGGGLDIAGQQLDATALDNLYTDLGSVSSYGGTNPLIVRGNPGTSGDTPSIATAKGYTVYGS